MHRKIPFLLFFYLTSCSDQSNESVNHVWQTMAARNNTHSQFRPLIYHAVVPPKWIRIDPDSTISILDTTQAICEYWIHEQDDKIRITIHTFPIHESIPRIPPIAQINRWKTQFDQLDSLDILITPQSHGGFTGLYFEATGIYQNMPNTMMGWSMQLATEFERKLSLHRSPLDSYKLADFTIKVVGTPSMIERYKPDITQFAKSFELMDELPLPL